jgi:hypothetical protein
MFNTIVGKLFANVLIALQACKLVSVTVHYHHVLVESFPWLYSTLKVSTLTAVGSRSWHWKQKPTVQPSPAYSDKVH